MFLFDFFFSKFSNANSNQFWAIVDEVAGATLPREINASMNAIMNTWTHQEGYPLVQCRRTTNGTVRLSQQPFCARADTKLPTASTNADKCRKESLMEMELWWIPVSLTNSQSMRCNAQKASVVWLTPSRPSVELVSPVGSDQWIIANFQYSGYFRVNYDDDNWNLIAAQLSANHSVIPVVTRAQLVDDAFALAEIGLISYDIPIKLTEYLDKEDQDDIRQIVFSHLNVAAELSADKRDRALLQVSPSPLMNLQG